MVQSKPLGERPRMFRRKNTKIRTSIPDIKISTAPPSLSNSLLNSPTSSNSLRRKITKPMNFKTTPTTPATRSEEKEEIE